MALVEGCKHTLEVTVPVEEIQKETERVIAKLQQQVRLPGFRPGKAPVSLIRTRFQQDIRQEVLESILPKAFHRQAAAEKLAVIGTPDITDVHFHDNEPLRFTAEFEIAPEITLGEYRGLEVPYAAPQVMDEDVEKRLDEMREQKADYVNEDPRPLADGDFAVVALRSVSGIEGDPIEQEEIQLQIGGADTLPAFTENLRGLSPGDEKELDVEYPEEFGAERLAGKTVRFHVTVNGVRRKELPEVNDEFAQDLGDFQTAEELRTAVRQSITREQEFKAQQEAKNQLVEKLIDTHDFPVPETYLDRQIESSVEQQLRSIAGPNVDPRTLKLDWAKIKESQREKATREVKGSLLLEEVADAEKIQATQEEIDQQVQRLAKEKREPVVTYRAKLEKDGTMRRIAAHIRTEKTLNFLFENARKVAPEPVSAEV